MTNTSDEYADETFMPGYQERPAVLRSDYSRRPVSRRLRLLGYLLGKSGPRVEDMTDAQLIAEQTPAKRGLTFNVILGRRAEGVNVQDDLHSNQQGSLRVRHYTPARGNADKSAVLYFHGGGWVSGDVEQADWWCTEFARRTKTMVLSLDYRLAPRHRFPSGLRDAYAALCWVHENSDWLGVSKDRISVQGDSAGANLAAALCLYTRRRRGPRIHSQTLINPALDLTFQSHSMLENANAPLLTAASIRAYARHYLGPSRATDPLASPLLESDLSDLPAALIQVAEHDPLRDDGWRYASRLSDAGVPVRITEYAGAPHGLTNFPYFSATGRQALAEACIFHEAPFGR